jgi:hypothetical protein
VPRRIQQPAPPDQYAPVRRPGTVTFQHLAPAESPAVILPGRRRSFWSALACPCHSHRATQQRRVQPARGASGGAGIHPGSSRGKQCLTGSAQPRIDKRLGNAGAAPTSAVPESAFLRFAAIVHRTTKHRGMAPSSPRAIHITLDNHSNTVSDSGCSKTIWTTLFDSAAQGGTFTRTGWTLQSRDLRRSEGIRSGQPSGCPFRPS